MTVGSPRIAFQGERGSFSDLACRETAPGHEPYGRRTFEDAFAAVAEGEAELALIPVDNSQAGRVADVHHLLPDSSLRIVGEAFLRVRCQLLGVPGARLEAVTAVHSHVHALNQCRGWIRRRGVEGVVETDTAGAAAEVARRGDPRRAAIASSLAAELHGLEVLDRNIEDAAHNTTRFLLMARRDLKVDRGRAVLTTIVFEVRNLPAALYKALGGFATNGVNLLKLESAMTSGSFTSTRFYCDFEGHPEDPPVRRALEELRVFSRSFRILGAYPADPGRPSGPRPLT